jgi:hypothetical protein
MWGICKKPKNLRTNNSQTAKSSDFVGYEENAANGGIYSHYGVIDRTVHLRRPDARCIGNMQTGCARPDGVTHRPPGGCRMRPDSIRSCPDDWAPYPSELQESTVRTINPSGRSTLKHQQNWEKFTEIKFPQVSVRTRMYNQLIT